MPTKRCAQLEQAHQIQFRLAQDIAPRLAEPGYEPLQVATSWMQPEQCDFGDESDAPTADDSPVFIVGFPRSGTTMLEQMLDAHPRYVSMDERTLLQTCIERMEAKGFDYHAQLDRLCASDLAELRGLYRAEAAKVVQLAPGQILVDKNPLNMLRLPMIRRLFPERTRHPRAAPSLRRDAQLLHAELPLARIHGALLEPRAAGEQLRQRMRFWIHHQPLLFPDALVLRYEETVTDFLAQVERIADYLGIEDRAPLATFRRARRAQGLHQYAELFPGHRAGERPGRGALASISRLFRAGVPDPAAGRRPLGLPAGRLTMHALADYIRVYDDALDAGLLRAS